MLVMRQNVSAAICDANVLIDYIKVDEDLVRELVACWETVYVPDIAS
jgi:hypothetical protein